MRENWTYKKIGDLCNIKTGKLDANAANENGKYPFFTCSKEPMSINAYAYDCECVLIAGNGDLNVKYYNGKFNAYQRTYILNLKEEIGDITIPYIYDFFLLYVDELRRKSIGGIIKYIKLGDLANAKIPVPPLSEQQAIVSELDKINELISLKKAQLSDLDALAQSIFYDMFGDPIENEKGWEVKKLGEIGDLARGVSKFRPRNAPELLGGAMPLIQTGDVSKAGMFIKEFNSTYSDLGVSQSKIWKAGTLCVTIAATIGKCAILGFDACFPDSVVGFTVRNEKCNNEYVYFIFKRLQAILEDKAPAVAQKNINLKILNGLEVPLPPLSLQQNFAKRIELIEQQKAQISSTIKDLETLLASRMQYWFD